MMRKHKHVVLPVMAAIALLMGIVPTAILAAPSAQEVGQELLKNPGFEGTSCSPGSPPGECWDNWTRATFNGAQYNEIYSPQEWVTFWNEGVNPDDPDGKKYGRPECKVIADWGPWHEPVPRIHSGHYSVQQFGFWRAIDSGLYQTVTGLSPGAVVQASFWAHSWTCNDDKSGPYSCGDPFAMRFRVGIDPNGGTNPWSSGIIWVDGYFSDVYGMVGPVQATVGEGGAVTVFLNATGKWTNKHNDAYMDDASLVYITPPEPPTDTPLPPPPTNTPGPPPTPLPPPTPRPDGSVVHIVQSGETLFGIALQYGIDVAQLEALNVGSLGPNNMIFVGQELVISVPSETPTPLPTATLPASPTPETGSVCVLVYRDRDGDGFRTAETEELLPNATIALSDDTGLVGQYTTDGLSEPYCFTGLTVGSYRVTMQPPAGYIASGPADMALALGTSQVVDVAFGAQRGEATPAETEETGSVVLPSSNDSESGAAIWPRVLRWGARVSGIVVLLLAVGVAVVFVLSRRQ